ncbi:MAG TPA: hypothetical protein VFS17_04725 [Methylophilaceae bacterium]|nr:hypothetical protein [Methylophilaceae bacterium]
MVGNDTLAMEVSSTFMKVASDRAMVPSTSVLPFSGGGGGRSCCVGCAIYLPVSTA